jgi:hypothetical protein
MDPILNLICRLPRPCSKMLTLPMGRAFPPKASLASCQAHAIYLSKVFDGLKTSRFDITKWYPCLFIKISLVKKQYFHYFMRNHFYHRH